jgi:hypothetical protein
MRKLPILLILFISSPLLANAQPKKTDWQKDNLLGQVKMVEEVHFKASEKFGDVVPETKRFIITTEFNKEGWLKSFEFDDVEDKEKITRTFKYNDKNLVTEEKEVNDGEVSIGKATYDSRDLLVELNEYDKKGNLTQKVKNKYDSARRITRSDIYDSDGSLRISEISEYDFFLGSGFWKKRINNKAKTEEHWVYELSNNEDNPPQLRQFDGEAEVLDLDLIVGGDALRMKAITPKDPKKEVKNTTYTYNSKGLAVSEEVETSRNKVVSSKTKRIFEYDKYGNKTLEKDSEKYYTTYTYEYDATGNWIKQVETRYSYGSIYHYMSERKIRYY